MKTAYEEYTEARQDVRELLCEIKNKLNRQDAATSDVNYGHVGSMKHVKMELKEILDFIGGTK